MSKAKPNSKAIRIVLIVISSAIILEGGAFAALGAFNVNIAACMVFGLLVLIYAIFAK